MMVIDEAFDGWKESKTPHDYAKIFDDWWQRDIEAMVLRDRNHPSIIIWSTGNEIIERKKPEAAETAKILADCIRKIDPTRPVTSALTTWDKDWEMFDHYLQLMISVATIIRSIVLKLIMKEFHRGLWFKPNHIQEMLSLIGRRCKATIISLAILSGLLLTT
jgi:hypothetical protein